MAQSIDALLASYPRQRPPLSDAHRAVYEQEYRLNREGTRPVEGAAKKLEAWMHRQVLGQGEAGAVLELGAGSLNHLAFEPENRLYDAVEPLAFLYRDSPQRARVRDIFASVHDIPPERRYRRILSVAVLEHMCDLPREVARAALLLADGGMFRAGIPSESGFLWGVAWRFSTGLAYRLRTGLDYGQLMRHEHVNTAPEIISLLSYLFEDLRVRRFPLPFHHLSFYTAITAARPRVQRCCEVLESKTAPG